VTSANRSTRTAEGKIQPDSDCDLCPRLADFRKDNRKAFPHWHNRPVSAFGDLAAALLIVGLAPGLKGANRTGRPFTGDFAGDLLYATLIEQGLAKGSYRASPDDGLQLVGCRISNAVKCVPPQNKPTPKEIANCNGFLRAEIVAMPNLRAILALGRIAHDAALSALGRKKSHAQFAHGLAHDLGGELRLFDSYHCSRYNTNTNRLTPAMFRLSVGEAGRWARGPR
jgi:uracil-DNA glycosylase family 4